MNESNHTTVPDRLRYIADWLDANPDAAPSVYGHGDTFNILDARTHDLDAGVTVAQDMATIARRLGGTWEKCADAMGYFELRREITPWFAYKIYAPRENVCERVVVGVETVEVADPEAVAALPRVTEEREVVSWVCPPSLLRAAP